MCTGDAEFGRRIRGGITSSGTHEGRVKVNPPPPPPEINPVCAIDYEVRQRDVR